MFIQIDLADSTAIYEQIVQQVKFAIASGSVKSHEMIPSVRELSRQLALNPNTVARAYRTLQDEEIVYVKRGTGLAVAQESQNRCKVERKSWFEEKFRRLFDELLRSRVPWEEVQEIAHSQLNRFQQCNFGT